MKSVQVTGIAEVDRVIARVDRRITRDRQKVVRTAATRTLVPAMRALASGSPGKAGGMLAKATTARNGRAGEVLVGPKTGKSGVWWRHIFIGGAKAHAIGGAKAATRSGPYAKRGATGRRFLYNAGGPFIAEGPVMHPAQSANPFVRRGADAGLPAFKAALAAALFSPKEDA